MENILYLKKRCTLKRGTIHITCEEEISREQVPNEWTPVSITSTTRLQHLPQFQKAVTFPPPVWPVDPPPPSPPPSLTPTLHSTTSASTWLLPVTTHRLSPVPPPKTPFSLSFAGLSHCPFSRLTVTSNWAPPTTTASTTITLSKHQQSAPLAPPVTIFPNGPITSCHVTHLFIFLFWLRRKVHTYNLKFFY